MKSYIFLLVLFIFNTVLNAQWFSQSMNATGYFAVVQFSNDSVGWMSSNNPSKIYKTTNGGELWFIQHETDGPISSTFFLNENIGWFTDLDSYGNRLIFTSDGGANWVQRYSGNDIIFNSLHFFDANNGIAGVYAGLYEGQILKTTDGGNVWTVLYHGFNANTFYFLNNLIGWCGGLGDSTNILKTTDGGDNWAPLPTNLEGEVSKIQFFSDAMGWASVSISGVLNRLYFTNDGGISWKLKIDSVNDFWFTDVNTGWYIVDDKIFQTTNGGTDWYIQHSDSGHNLLRLYFLNSDLGWAAGYDGYILHLHTNNSGTPVELVSFNANVSGNDVYLNWMTASEINNYGFEIERSNKLLNPNEISSGQALTGGEIDDWEKIGFLKGKGTITEIQNYHFTDIGLLSGKYSYRLKQIDFNGTFKYSNVIGINVGMPSKFSLEQNYPNPFNPVTKIKFSVPQIASGFSANKVILKVYDLLGREIAILVNEEKQAGTYEVKFNASNLSGGTYFYRLQAGDFVETRKLSLLK